MKKEDIHLGDIQRILLGDAPVVFLVEIFLRSVFIFLLVIVRLLGKRMNAQLSLTEMSIMFNRQGNWMNRRGDLCMFAIVVSGVRIGGTISELDKKL